MGSGPTGRFRTGTVGHPPNRFEALQVKDEDDDNIKETVAAVTGAGVQRGQHTNDLALRGCRRSAVRFATADVIKS